MYKALDKDNFKAEEIHNLNCYIYTMQEHKLKSFVG